MINLLIGPPGAGKSYEAVVYHLLPALARGRRVVTNLPLDLERLGAIDASYPAMIDKRETGQGESRAFASITDYGDTWRSATGTGPLYIIDECHLALPRGLTPLAVEEWYSLHRHESADVLLITQSYGKLSRSIVDLVQVVYRTKKGTAFGSANQYIRKVQDGIRGDVVNTTVRKYEKRYFPLYQSHTRGGGEELAANDIIPIWRRWPFIGAAIFLPIAVILFSSTGATNILKPKQMEVQKVAQVQTQKEAPTEQKSEPPAQETAHPYTGRTLHIIGVISNATKLHYVFALAQNGQTVSEVSSNELIKLGYKLEPATDCGVRVSMGTWSSWVICDSPQVGIVPTKGVTPASKEA